MYNLILLVSVFTLLNPLIALKVDNETYAQSEISFGYGLMYESYGKMVHGLNRYDMMVGLRFPDLSIIEEHLVPKMNEDWCEYWKAPATVVLYRTCRHMMPAYINNLKRIEHFQFLLKRIITDEIPALLPGFQFGHMKQDDRVNREKEQADEERIVVDEIRNQEQTSSTNKLESKDNETKVQWKQLNRKISYQESDERNNNSKPSQGVMEMLFDKVSATYGETKKRIKRWVAAAASLVIEGISAYMNYRKDSQLKKGMKMLLKNQHKLSDGMIELRKDFMTLAKTSAEQMEILAEALQIQSEKVNRMFHNINILALRIQDQNTRIADNSNAILFLTASLINVMEVTEKYKMLLLQLQLELDHFLDAIDSLAKGYLSHTVISPNRLGKIIEHVKQVIGMSYPEFELIAMSLKWYYQIPLVKFTYDQGMIAISIPVFVKPRLQEILTVYQIKSTPVPYHINPNMIDEYESVDIYTQIQPTAELLAVSSDTNMALSVKDLERCHRVGALILCEHVMLMKHHTEQTCESAIYNELGPYEVKKHCKDNIVYWKNLKPPPTVFDAGEYLLLAHLPEPWRVQCKHTDQILSTMESSPYCVIQKSDLCGCTINAGTVFVQDNIVYCKGDLDAHIQLWYPVNMMTMLYQYIEHIKGSLTDMTIFKKPYLFDPKELGLVDVMAEGVMEDPEAPIQVNFDKGMQNPLQKLYVDMADKSIDLQDPSEYFNSKPLIGFAIIAGVVTIILVIIIIPYVLKATGVDIKLQSLGATVGKLATTMHGLQKLPKGVSDDGRTQPTNVEIQIDNLMDFMLLFVQIAGVVLIIYYLVRWTHRGIRAVYHFVKAYSLNDVQIVNTWWKHFSFDRTDIYLQLVNRNIRYSIEVYIGFYFGNPEDLIIQGEFSPGDLLLESYCVYDLLILDWHNCEMYFNNCNLQLPQQIQVGIFQKYFVRYLMKHDKTSYRIIAHNNSSKKVRAVTHLCSLGHALSTPTKTKDLKLFEDIEFTMNDDSVIKPTTTYKPMVSFKPMSSNQPEEVTIEVELPPPPSSLEKENLFTVSNCLNCGELCSQPDEYICNRCIQKGVKLFS